MDNVDKTVFRQPRPGGDRTRMKGGAEPLSGAAVQAAQPAPVPTPNTETLALIVPGRGLNPLVSAADTLLAVHARVSGTARHTDVSGLYRQLSYEIRQFEERARVRGIKPEIILAARYVLCSVLDEAVLNTPWGSDSPWAQGSLLSRFHNETSGGEKFFQILERMLQAPAEHIDMLELMYLCLSLGFEGRYRLSTRGRDALEQLKDDLYRTIRRYRGEHERALSRRWKGLGKTRSTLSEYVPLWVLAASVALVLVMTYSGFRYWLYSSSNPVVDQLEQVIGGIETRERRDQSPRD
ncbi:type IVB secretion system protein IcmH/DotU [Marinimicrobium alkaliphilum]|uniref:type IVB secretion system protein IcmH/DotU n=1 Tax=Marinimicrobium alkaliphilum TaxID=2202654 RepID=UPI000DB9DC8C|nr:type IVB secretion system protein IcmH/DotU [Marinimicrobium alkaliphilum]